MSGSTNGTSRKKCGAASMRNWVVRRQLLEAAFRPLSRQHQKQGWLQSTPAIGKNGD